MPERSREASAPRSRVVVVLEASSVEAAETALSQLPFYRHGLIRFDLIPVGPFTNFERLFS